MNRQSCARAALVAFGVVLLSASSARIVNAQTPPPATSTTLAADLLKDWEGLKDTMVKLGDAMPPDKFNYKPTPELRSFADQLLHVAQANVGLIQTIDPKATAPKIPQKVADKAEAMKALADSFDFGTTVIKAQSNAAMGESVAGPRFLGASTRARIIYRAMAHTWDEYGAMTVYLRMNNVVPPASRGSM